MAGGVLAAVHYQSDYIAQECAGGEDRVTLFEKTVASEQELRELLGHPSRLVQNKVIERLDSHCRDFIHASPLLFLSTADASGCCDVSPRGTPRDSYRYWMIPISWSRTVLETDAWIPCEISCQTPTLAWCF